MIKISRESVTTPAILLSDLANKAFENDEAFFKTPLEKRIQRSHAFTDKVYQYPEVKQALERLFHDKCAYCESPLNGRGIIAHFRPKAGALGLDGSLDPDHYWWLAYRWENLYLSCEKCNFNKGNKFPVKGRRARLKTMPPAIYKAEETLLLDPCNDEPGESLLFTDDGMVVGLDERGKTTCEILDLNRTDLVQERKKVLNALSLVLEESPGPSGPMIGSFLEPGAPYLAACQQLASRQAQSRPLDDGLKEQVERHIPGSLHGKPKPPSASKQRVLLKSYLVEQHKRETTEKQVTISIANYIERIEIHNFRVIEDLSLVFPEPRQGYIPWIVLLGENGVGKSSVLKAVALALMDEGGYRRLKLDASRFVRYGSRSGFVRVYVSGYSRPFELHFKKGDQRFHKKDPAVRKNDSTAANRLQTWVFGYGGTRLLPLPGRSRPKLPGLAQVDNLFNPFMPLEDAHRWLLSLKGREGNQRFGHSARAIKRLLQRQDDDTLIRRGGDVVLRLPSFGTTIPLSELSDGYQSTVALAADIMSVALQDWKTAELAEGIVLLDEIDTHLHPSWKMAIVQGLREVFPRMQFLITTHDPLCVLGTRPGEVHVLNLAPETRRIRATQVDLPLGATPDQILTGFWFGLPSAYDDDTRRLLEQHRDLLRRGVPEQDTARLDLEAELRRRLGSFSDTSIDRMAQSVAAQVITDEHQDIGPEKRVELRDTLLDMLRKQRSTKEG
jgi:uncharacterized protein (TIGR02646 family)